MKAWHVLVGGGLIAGAAFLLSGSASADSGEPWPYPVDDLKPGAETDAAWDAICTCYRGGARELSQLVLCSLKQIWPEHPQQGPIPWERIIGRKLEGDHPTLQKRISKISGWAQAAIATKGRNCRSGDKKPDLPDVDDDEPAPEPGETPAETRRRILNALFLESPTLPKSGHFWLTKYQDGIGSKGQEMVARRALNEAGVPNALDYYNRLVRPLMQAMNRSSKWNVPLYGGPSQGPGAVNGIGVAYALNPWHENARAAILNGRMPKRAMTAAGKRISGMGTSYGLLWIPKFDERIAREDHELVVLAQDPPQELLELLTE